MIHPVQIESSLSSIVGASVVAGAAIKNPAALNIALQIFLPCIRTINEFYKISRVCRSFRLLAQLPDVIRHLFSRSIFELWPTRYPLPPSCPSGRIVAHLKNLTLADCDRLMTELNSEVKNFVQVSTHDFTDIQFTEHPHLYIDDLVGDTIGFLRRYARNVRDLKVTFQCDELFVPDAKLQSLSLAVPGARELYFGDYVPSNLCVVSPTDGLEGVTDAGFVNIGTLTDLRALTFKTRCNNITRSTFERLQACTRLEKLELQTFDRIEWLYKSAEETIALSEADIAKIAKVYKFRPMWTKPGDPPEFVAHSDRDEPSFPNLPILKTLNIFKLPHAENVSWHATQRARQFTVGRLGKVRSVGIKDDELVEIGKLTSLTELSICIHNANLGIRALEKLQRLQKLCLPDHVHQEWSLEDDTLYQTLATLKSLKHLHLQDIEAKEENSFKAMISSLGDLETLVIDGVNLTLSDLPSLASHPRLNCVTLSNVSFKKREEALVQTYLEAMAILSKTPALESLVIDLYGFNEANYHDFIHILASSKSLRKVTFRGLIDSTTFIKRPFAFTRKCEGPFALP